jgi:hypothetical protein
LFLANTFKYKVAFDFFCLIGIDFNYCDVVELIA